MKMTMAPSPSSHQIEELIFDLSSSERNVRLAAIFQLGTQISREEVRTALLEHQAGESDPEVAFFLEQTLAKQEPPGAVAPDQRSATSLPVDVLSVTPDRYGELVEPLRKLLPEERRQLIEKLFASHYASQAAEALIKLGQDFPFREVNEQVLRVMLFHTATGVRARSVYFAAKLAPERTLTFVPELLQKPSLLVRALALRLLYRYVPEQALRLLEELLDHPDAAQRGIGIGLLFQFPFEETAGALLRLIESGRVPPHSHEMLLVLIRSNPNTGFARKLAFLAISHPDAGDLDSLVEAAAHALILSGMEKGSLPALCRRLRESAEQEALSALSPIAVAKAVSATPDATRPTSDREHGSVPVTGVGHQQPNAGSGGETLTSQEIAARYLPLAERRDRNPEIAQEAFIAFQRHGFADPRCIDWGESLLAHAPQSLLLVVMRYLECHAVRRLTSHLPILAFHESAFVASQAVRILRRQEGAAFLRRLDTWLKDPDPRALRAGLAGLLQMDFNRVRPLVMQHLRSGSRQDLLDGIARLIRVNPDHRLIAELRGLAAASTTTSRREFLQKLADECLSEFRRMYGAGGESAAVARLREVWADQVESRLNDLLERLREVHLCAGDSIPEDPGRRLRVVAVAVGLAAILLTWYTADAPFLGVSQSVRQIVEPGRIQRAVEQQRLSALKPVMGILDSYDPLNRTWKFRTSDGGVHKLRFSPGVAGLAAGQRVSAELSFLETTPLGYNLYMVRQFQILSH